MKHGRKIGLMALVSCPWLCGSVLAQEDVEARFRQLEKAILKRSVPADPLTDPRLGRAFVVMTQDKANTPLLEDIVTGRIKVYWWKPPFPLNLVVGGAILGKGAPNIYLNQSTLLTTRDAAAQTLVHEGEHLRGRLEKGWPATEMQAYRRQAEFTTKVGLRNSAHGFLAHKKIQGIDDARLQAEIMKKLPVYRGAPGMYQSQQEWRSLASRDIRRYAVRDGVGGLAHAMGAHLVKESIKAAMARDGDRVSAAFGDFTEQEFWRSVLVFSGATGLTHAGLALTGHGRLLLTMAGRTAPFVFGLAAHQMLYQRNFSMVNLTSTTGAFLAGSVIVGGGHGIAAFILSRAILPSIVRSGLVLLLTERFSPAFDGALRALPLIPDRKKTIGVAAQVLELDR